MSHHPTHYVMLGVDASKLDLPEEIRDKYYHEEVDGLTMTVDCSSECSILGMVLVKGDEFEGMEIFSFGLDELEKLSQEVHERMYKAGLNRHIAGSAFHNLRVYAFTEWG